jgi:hypothetical protein
MSVALSAESESSESSSSSSLDSGAGGGAGFATGFLEVGFDTLSGAVFEEAGLEDCAGASIFLFLKAGMFGGLCEEKFWYQKLEAAEREKS